MSTSDIEIAEPPIEETEFPYFGGTDCDTGNGEYWRSVSLLGWTLAGDKVLGNAFVYDCC